jgi:hypothetical protein
MNMLIKAMAVEGAIERLVVLAGRARWIPGLRATAARILKVVDRVTELEASLNATRVRADGEAVQAEVARMAAKAEADLADRYKRLLDELQGITGYRRVAGQWIRYPGVIGPGDPMPTPTISPAPPPSYPPIRMNVYVPPVNAIQGKPCDCSACRSAQPQPNVVIFDDPKAAAIARSLGLPPDGSAGVPGQLPAEPPIAEDIKIIDDES